MYTEIRKKATKKVKAKKGFYVTATVFIAVSIILMIVSFTLYNPIAAFWVRFPILVLGLVLGIIYVSIFGLNFGALFNQKDWEEEQIEKEINRLYRQRRNELPPGEDLDEEDRLELKELERLKKKLFDYDEFVWFFI